MSGFSFATTIHGKQRPLMVRTVNFDSIHRIVINLNDGDTVLHAKELPYDPLPTDQELMNLVKQQHEDRVESLQELMKISLKLEARPDAESNHKLGLVFLNQGLGREAAAELERSLSLDAENAPVLNHYGLALLLEKKFDPAIKAFQRAVELRPTYPDLHNNLGLALIQTGCFDEAMIAFEKALALHPKYAEAFLNLALCLTSKAVAVGPSRVSKDKIKEYLSQAVEYNAYYDNEYFRMAQAYLTKDQFAEARQALVESKAVGLSQTGSQIYHEFYLRLKYGEEGVDRKATEKYIAKLEDLLEKHPHYVDIHNDLGVAYLIQCRFLFNRAVSEFKKALAINPQYAKAAKNLKLAENEGKGFLILLRAILYF